jgi:hypothetical protein
MRDASFPVLCVLSSRNISLASKVAELRSVGLLSLLVPRPASYCHCLSHSRESCVVRNMKTSVELPSNRSAISLESHVCEVFQDETHECERCASRLDCRSRKCSANMLRFNFAFGNVKRCIAILRIVYCAKLCCDVCNYERERY